MKFSQERKLLHNQIINQAFEGKEKSNDPYYLLVCGGPAAGKSTLMRKFEEKGHFLDCTIVKINLRLFRNIPEYQKYFGSMPHPEKMEELIEEFYYLVSEIVEKAAEEGYNVMFDDHGDQILQYQHHCDIYNAYNFRNIAIGAFRTEEGFYKKIKQKQEAGRYAYTEEVHRQSIDIYKVFNQNWESKIIPNFDGADLFFMDDDIIELMASYQNEDGKIKKRVINQEYYKMFSEAK